MDEQTDVVATVRAFLAAFASNSLDDLRLLLDDAFVGRVTTADGGVREIDADTYVASVREMDVPSAHLRVEITDVTLVRSDQVLVMVEVHAQRGDRHLHNFSGQLAAVRNGRIVELSMVEALPEESDRFWAR